MSLIEKKDFTIILVDDDLDSVKPEMDEVKTYLDGLGLRTNLLEDDTGNKVEQYLKDNLVDLVVTDRSIVTSDDGEKIAGKVQDYNISIDVLVYSAKELKVEDYKRLSSYYTSVHVYPDKTIADPVKSLIDRNLAKWDDIIFLRGIVISKIIDVELKMNEIFAKYFNVEKVVSPQFNNLILENTSNSVEGKRKALRSILDGVGLKKEMDAISGKIKRLQSIRNDLAHCKVDHKKGIFLDKMGQLIPITKDDMKKIFSELAEVEEKLEQIKSNTDLVDRNKIKMQDQDK